MKRLIIKRRLNQLHSNVVKSEDANTSSNETNPNTIKSTEQQQSIESNTSDKPKVDNQQAQSQPKDNDDNQGDALKTATQSQQQTLTKKESRQPLKYRIVLIHKVAIIIIFQLMGKLTLL